MVPLLAQLPEQPRLVHAHAVQVLAENAAVHDELGEDLLLFRGNAHILRCGRAAGRHGQNGQAAVGLIDRRLDGAKVEKALLAALDEELAQVETGLFHVAAVELAVVKDDRRRAADIFAQARAFARQCLEQPHQQRPDHHGRERTQRLFQLRGHLGGNGADGDAVDVVKDAQLRDLAVAHQL